MIKACEFYSYRCSAERQLSGRFTGNRLKLGHTFMLCKNHDRKVNYV